MHNLANYGYNFDTFFVFSASTQTHLIIISYQPSSADASGFIEKCSTIF